MKKVCTFISLLLLLFVGTAQAQRAWDVSTDNATEILTGDEHQYVLQQGINTAGWSSSGYLSNKGAFVAKVDASCIYTFVQVDEKSEGDLTLPVYVLKNVENGMYLTQDGYAQSQLKAWKFTCAQGHAKQDGEDNNLWENYHNAIAEAKCPGAADAGAWVFCDIESRKYMCFWGAPAFSDYQDTNNWFIYTATERELTAYEKLTIVFDEYYTQEINEENYPVGTTPGCISQEVYQQMLAAYNEASALIADPDSDPTACDRAREAVIASFEAYAESLVPVGPGYYLMVNKRSLDAAYDSGSNMKCTKELEKPATYTEETAKYIWQVVPSAVEGKYYFKNFATGRYMGKGPGTSQIYPTVTDTTVKVTFEQLQGIWFRVKDDANYAHCDGSYNVVVWNSTGDGNKWRFDPVPADTIAKLLPIVEQSQMNKKLAGLVSDVESEVNSLKLKSGLTMDGNYYASGAGLVSAFEKCNATETTEGSEAAAFDGDLTTYYHTLWHDEGAPTNDWHWVQFDLGKEVSEIYLKFSQRHNNRNGNPSRIAIVAPEDGNLEAPMWMDTLYKDTVIYQYSTSYPAGALDSTTYVGKINFGKPVQHFRMAVTRTKANGIHGYGPCWHVSELRIYDAADCVENPSYALVPEQIRNEVAAAIEAAKAEIEAGTATQATYDRLETAYEAFMEAYPDPTDLLNAVETAKEILETAVEGDGLAYFQAGAKDGLAAVIKSVEDAIAAKEALTLDEINALDKQLKDGLKEFNSKLNVPEGGKVYRIVNTSGYDTEGNEYAENGALMASANADYNGNPVWKYKDYEGVDERFNTLWYVEKTEEGYTFRNLANGLYLGNPFQGLTEEEIEEQISYSSNSVGYSKEPTYFGFEAYHVPGNFLITLHDGDFLHMAPGGSMVFWYDRKATRSQFEVREVTDDEGFSSTFVLDATAGAPQIKCLPFEVLAAYSNNGNVMKVLGVKDNAIQMVAFGDDETIPAGAPFFFVTDPAEGEGSEGENFINVDLMGGTLEENLNMEYVYEPVNQDGMVSAPIAFEIEPGYGILYNGAVAITEGGEDIAAGSGFFNSSLKTTDLDGDYVLPLDGEITGEGTAVEGVEVVKNVPTDVYTIAGVKVRSNVKAGVATKGLPKGIYIVGGKKVIVK